MLEIEQMATHNLNLEDFEEYTLWVVAVASGSAVEWGLNYRPMWELCWGMVETGMVVVGT